MAGLLGAYGYPDGPVRIASGRQFQNSIEESVKKVVERYIQAYGLQGEFDVQKYSIDHETGSHMIFPGFERNVSSWMSMEDFDVLWIEQAETLEDQMGVIAPTMRKPGSELWFTWNTAGRDQWCYQRFELNDEPEDVSILVNWQDNPWWFPWCESCGVRYDFDRRETACECGGAIAPGLWELEQLRSVCQEQESEVYPNRWMGEPADTDVESKVLPYQMVEACRQAFRKGLAPGPGGRATIAGLDLAEGGADKCALVIGTGPTIQYIDVWPGVTGDLQQAAVRAHEACMQYGVGRLYYDASSPIRSEFLRLGAPYPVRPVNFGGVVGGPDVRYERGGRPPPLNKDVFARLNIQMATAVRLRMQRTMQLLRGEDVDPYRCCFIDPDAVAPGCRVTNMESYLSELTGPTRRIPPGSGKWELDKRGGDEAAESPDSFDATCLAFRVDCDRLHAV